MRVNSSTARSSAGGERIRPTASYSDLAGCDFVIEAVFEQREIKAEVTAKAEAVIAPTAVFASNTSTLPISGLAQASERPARFIGLHFFSPVEKMPLVEIIVGKKTSDETLARALDYVGQLRKTPIVVNDSRGFYTSRCFGTFLYEGMQMLAEGVTPALIENGARTAGMPVGPLAVADEVTIDLQWKVIRQTEQDLGKRFRRPVSYDVVRRFVEELKRPGRRFGAGFYDYPTSGRKRLWPGLASVYPPAAKQPDAAEVGTRLLHVQALEAARCIEEGVVTTAAEADLGSILGWGFPARENPEGRKSADARSASLGPPRVKNMHPFNASYTRHVALFARGLARRHGQRFKPSRWLRDRAERGVAFHAAVPAAAA